MLNTRKSSLLQRYRSRLMGMLSMTAIATGAMFAPVQAQAEPLQIAVGSDPAYVSYYVAQEEGIFKKHGLDVELLKFGAGGASADALVAGQGKITSVAEASVLVRMARGDMRALGIVGESGDYLKLVVRPEIKDFSQIKTFGVVPGGVIGYLTDLSLKKHNIDPSTVKLVNSAAPELPALLARGDIDAFWILEPFAGIAVRQGAKLMARSKDVGYSFHFWVTAMGPWFEQHKKESQTVLQALAEACEVVQKDPKRAAEAVRAQVKIPVDVTMGFLDEVSCGMRDFTPKDFASYDDVADYLYRAKITPERVDYQKKLERGFYQPKQ